MFDTIIIGAGPIGLACGIEAKKRGLSYLIIEKGCLVNSIFNYPANMTFFSTSDKIEIGDIPFVSINFNMDSKILFIFFVIFELKFSAGNLVSTKILFL